MKCSYCGVNGDDINQSDFCDCRQLIQLVGEWQAVRVQAALPKALLQRLKANGWIKRLSLAPRYHTQQLKDLIMYHRLAQLGQP